MKRDKLDRVFSELIRTRAGWRCERCGKHAKGAGLHCSHFYSRRHQGTRFDPQNAFAHCFGCHQYLGGNPAIFTEWARDKMGEEVFEDLRERHNQIVKRTKADKEALYQDLKRQLKEVKERI